MSWILRRRRLSWLTGTAGALGVLLVMAAPADARRSSGSSPSSAKSTPAPAAPSAAPATPSLPAKGASAASAAVSLAKVSAIDVALKGLQIQRSRSNKLRFLYELPEMKANTLRDGRHFHLGEVTSMFGAPRLVGWITRGEFVELERHHLVFLLEAVSFKSIEAFQQHIVKYGPSREPNSPADPPGDIVATTPVVAAKATISASDKAASGAGAKSAGWSQTQTFALGGGGVLLLGFLGYCVVSWRRNRVDAATTAAAGTGPDRGNAGPATRPAAKPPRGEASRVASTDATKGRRPARVAALATPLSRAPGNAPATPSHRAPRELGALTRPTPA